MKMLTYFLQILERNIAFCNILDKFVIKNNPIISTPNFETGFPKGLGF